MNRKIITITLLIMFLMGSSVYADELSNSISAAKEKGISGTQIALIVNKAHLLSISNAETADMINTLINAKQNRVPVSFISSKIMEGLTKRVPAQKVIMVANRLEQAYVKANAMYNSIPVKGRRTGELKETIAMAVLNGLKPSELRSLYNAAPNKSESYYIIGTVSLSSLISMGYTKKDSLSFMISEFKNNQTADNIQKKTFNLINAPPGERGMSMGNGTDMDSSHEMNTYKPEQPYKQPETAPMEMNMGNKHGRD